MLSIDEAIEREMTFEEEYVILQKEAKELFDKEDREIEPPESNCVVRRALRCIKKLVSELEELKDYQDKNKMVVRVDCDFENIDNIKNKIDELSKYAESQYNKAIDDVLKLPKYTFYDTSKEFMNIRIDAISIEDILKLKEKTNEQRKQSKPNRND